MQARQTRIVRWRIRCEEHGGECITYELTGDSYGHWLGRTPAGELAEFNVWGDPVFGEVLRIVRELLRQVGREARFGECLRHVLGAACDPAASGQAYSFTWQLHCPACRAANSSQEPAEPPRLEIVELPAVSHGEWKKLSEGEKRERIRQAMVDSGALPAAT